MNYFVFQDKQKYEICLNAFKSCDELVHVYVDLCERYPEIKVIIDPFLPHVSKIHFTFVSSRGVITSAPSQFCKWRNTLSSLNENMLQLDVNCFNNRNFVIF